MIYFILTLFFASLVSIIFMIGRKLMLLENGQIDEGASFEIPYLKEIKHVLTENIKKYEHMGLVAVVKSYIQSMNFFKNKFQEIKIKIQHIHIKKHPNGEVSERAEVSKFLKAISGYSHKIKEIKHKITEEENNS
ncbi:MAG: hypothetical protein KGL67_01420 [Patescibacteria group bacterium]|nr:hypothetical protein [Patescibacteria group bacterium]